MAITTLLGLTAGALTTISFVPQVLRAWRTRSTRDISFAMFALMFTGVAMWLVYGVVLGDLPLIIANGVTLLLAGSIIVAKLRYD